MRGSPLSKKKRGRRKATVQIEEWEIELARGVAARFPVLPADREDISADLFRKLLELKSARPRGVKDWRSFLARALLNCATDSYRRIKFREGKSVPLSGLRPGESGESLEELLSAKVDPLDLGIEVRKAWDSLTPELRELWGLLVEEKGKAAAVARRLGRPVSTIKDLIYRLRQVLRDLGF